MAESITTFIYEDKDGIEFLGWRQDQAEASDRIGELELGGKRVTHIVEGEPYDVAKIVAKLEPTREPDFT